MNDTAAYQSMQQLIKQGILKRHLWVDIGIFFGVITGPGFMLLGSRFLNSPMDKESLRGAQGLLWFGAMLTIILAALLLALSREWFAIRTLRQTLRNNKPVDWIFWTLEDKIEAGQLASTETADLVTSRSQLQIGVDGSKVRLWLDEEKCVELLILLLHRYPSVRCHYPAEYKQVLEDALAERQISLRNPFVNAQEARYIIRKQEMKTLLAFPKSQRCKLLAILTAVIGLVMITGAYLEPSPEAPYQLYGKETMAQVLAVRGRAVDVSFHTNTGELIQGAVPITPKEWLFFSGSVQSKAAAAPQAISVVYLPGDPASDVRWKNSVARRITMADVRNSGAAILALGLLLYWFGRQNAKPDKEKRQ